VITYFLLCGYPPFDRESNLEEMQAILIADYSFTPIEFWRSVSQTAREFIKRCLTVDPMQRMTSHQALQHPWIKGVDPLSPQKSPADGDQEDLLPVVKKNFNARRTLHKAIDTVRAINKLREGGGLMAAGMMDGAMSIDPKPRPEVVNGSKVTSGDGDGDGHDGRNHQSMEGVAQGSDLPPPQSVTDKPATSSTSTTASDPNNNNNNNATAQPDDGDAMEIDGRGNGHGQTQEQMRVQEKKVKDTIAGLWSHR
jgi:calcium/calmodulin-dependent protein kinase I